MRVIFTFWKKRLSFLAAGTILERLLSECVSYYSGYGNHVSKYIRHISTPNISNPIKCPEKSQMLRNSANVTDAVLWWGWLTVMHAHHHFGLELNFYIKRIFPFEFEYDINENYPFFCLFFFFQNQPKKIHNNNNWHSFNNWQ